MQCSAKWLERAETVYQKRLHKIGEVLSSEGSASKRFKGIQWLIDQYEWNDSNLDFLRGANLQTPGGFVVTDESDPLDANFDKELVETMRAIAARMPETDPTPVSPAPVKRSGASTLTPEKEALIAKNKAAALAAKEQKARAKADEIEAAQRAHEQEIFESMRWMG